jgi:cell division protease FtsH
MVTQLGMSDKLGPLTYGKQRRLAFLGVESEEERNYSEETARIIDAEIRGLVEEGERRAREILEGGRTALDALAEALQAHEVLGGEEVERIVREARAAA